MRIPSPAVKALPLVALSLALPLTACSSGTSDSSAGTAKPKQAASKDPNAGLLTGAQLKKVLAPTSFFPAGFAVDASGARDTGGTYVEPSSAPASAKPDCAKLDGTSWIAVTGVSGVSFAQNDFVNKNTSEDIAQEIDVFRGTTSSTVLKGVEEVASACATFTDDQTHTKVKVTGQAASGLGDAAYTVTLTDGAWQNGATLIAARVGTNVVSVMSTDGHDNGAATAKKLTAQLVASLKKTA
ncbi:MULTISPECIES: hypothetical protein [unclassified Streptomyces]|uniref:hypothetical protein n=1 Tax=unclassified Streptomyces TaxID=2593676 RepID=UPI00224C84A3|nr:MULTISPECIES: hypothetical protein [unclassified Streptomyces]MCX4649375.1 hypothetical protein [Streptomyces sp. NBC_01446]MCX5321426.1 hypothetical protein [Streptomyces sp. NBC_00120]